MTSQRSNVKLAEALSQVPGMPPDMIRRAVDGYYGDFTSPLATPEIQLVEDLKELARQPTTGPKAKTALANLAGRVIDGEFDATREESDEWAASPEGQAVLAEFPPELRRKLFGA
jgi:hypothetical protein